MTELDRRAAHRPRLRRRWNSSTTAKAKTRSGAGGRPLLGEIEKFGDNPGRLRMLAYAPKDLAVGAPLVVVLHGCSQDALGYDRHAGWTALAEHEGFAVLYPEQRRENNGFRCFNWFRASDAARGLGETRSIREMVETMATAHEIDRSRIFVVGLSAGGAMAAALLADYPEVFSGGAVIAGLPCGAALTMQQAVDAMSRPTARTPEQWGDVVRAGSPHQGPWPRISIWHGGADATVAPQNADELVKQWVDVHGAALDEFREETVGRHRRRIWQAGGRDVVEFYRLDGMGHGAPLDVRLDGERKGPFMFDAQLSSTRRIAQFWGLMKPERKISRPPARPKATTEAPAAPGPAPEPQAALGADLLSRLRRGLKALGLTR